MEGENPNELVLVDKIEFYGMDYCDKVFSRLRLNKIGFERRKTKCPDGTDDFKERLNGLLKGKTLVSIYSSNRHDLNNIYTDYGYYPPFIEAKLSSDYLKEIVKVVKSQNNLHRIVESGKEIKEIKVEIEGKVGLESRSFGDSWEAVWSEEFTKEFRIELNGNHERNVFVRLTPRLPVDKIAEDLGNQRVKLEWSAKLEWTDESQLPNAIRIGSDFLQRLFYEEDEKKDFVIVSGDGVEMRCHRFVLKRTSKWFEGILEDSEMVGKTGKLKLNGSGEGLNVFMKYLYGFEIPVSELTPRLSLELLRNGYTQGLHELVGRISAFLLGQEKGWFADGVDSLVELYHFMLKLNNQTKLRLHLLRILSSIPAEVKGSGRFQELDKDSAIELLSKMHETAMKAFPPK